MNNRPSPWLFAIVGLYLLLALASTVVVPLGEAPDEVDHFLYVQHLVQERAFPVMEPVFEENATLEANQPPLYYLLGAALSGWIDSGEPGDMPLNACFSYDPEADGRQTFYRHSAEEQFPWRGTVLAFHLVRVLSVLMGAGTVILTYELGKRLAPMRNRNEGKQDVLGLAAAAILAFNPQFIFITASANNDNLTAFLGAAVVLACVKAAQTTSPPATGGLSVRSIKRTAILALLVGLGLLTKFSLFGLWPLAFLAILVPAWRQRRIPWPELVIVTLIPTLIAGWWYYRGYVLYGDPLAWNVHLAAKGAYVLRTEPLRPADLIDFVRIHFESYWGWFGWLKIKLPLWIYWLLAGMVSAALLGLLKDVNDRRKAGDWSQVPLVFLFSSLAIIVIYASLLRYIQTINWSGYQGRLAFTAAGPAAVLIAAGLRSIGGIRLTQAAGAGLLALAAGSLIGIIAPAFPRPQIYQPDPEAVTFAAECVHFESGLALEAYTIGEPAYPGARLPVTLYGYGLKSSDGPQTVAVKIMGRNEESAGAGQSEMAWEAGEVVSTTVPLAISGDASPARAVLMVGILRPGGEWQAAASINGRNLDLPVSLTTLKIRPAEPVVARPQHEVMADFGQQMKWLGYDAAVDEAAVSLTFYWQATAMMSQDYTVFVHLLDSEGRLITQYDSQPQEGWYPTTIWEVGEVVTDRITLVLPPNAPPGPYQVAVGVYLLETLERLPVAVGGVQQPDGQMVIEGIGS